MLGDSAREPLPGREVGAEELRRQAGRGLGVDPIEPVPEPHHGMVGLPDGHRLHADPVERVRRIERLVDCAPRRGERRLARDPSGLVGDHALLAEDGGGDPAERARELEPVRPEPHRVGREQHEDGSCNLGPAERHEGHDGRDRRRAERRCEAGRLGPFEPQRRLTPLRASGPEGQVDRVECPAARRRLLREDPRGPACRGRGEQHRAVGVEQLERLSDHGALGVVGHEQALHRGDGARRRRGLGRGWGIGPRGRPARAAAGYYTRSAAKERWPSG